MRKLHLLLLIDFEQRSRVSFFLSLPVTIREDNVMVLFTANSFVLMGQ
jgi:hypothetical protein